MTKYGLFFLVLLGFSESVQAKLFNAQEFMLPNGMQVAVIENHKAPLIKHMVWYRIGSVDEDFGKGGSAHLLEHLMFRGTSKVPDADFNHIMDNLGVVSNAFTNYDVTTYHQFADISKLEALMALEADRMQNLNFNDQAFAAEQKIVLQERKQVVENDPESAFDERLNLILWGNSPYSRPITGTEDEIMALSAADIYKFYYQYYAPNNAILVLSGDIDVKTAKKLAEKYYGNIPAKDVTKRKVSEVKENFQERLTMRLPQIQSPKAVVKYLVPHENQEKQIYTFLVLAEYLGGGETSALYQDLVVEQKKAFAVSVYYRLAVSGNNLFSLSVIPTSDNDNEQIFTLLNEAMAKVVTEELDAPKLERVKQKMLADLIYANDNPSDAAYWVGYMLANGYSLAEVQNYAENIRKVSLEDVRAAYKNLGQISRVEGLLLPIKKEESHD